MRCNGGAAQPARQRGMALLTVLWMVAALSIMVMGMVRTIRTEIQLAGHARQISVVGALGDAAIHLVLQNLLSQNTLPNSLVMVDVPYRGQNIAVEVLPLNGLIDLNKAPVELLAALMTSAASVPPAQALLVAQSVDEWRAARDARGRAQMFEALEDLLQVPGIGYDLYANIAPLLTVDQAGSGRVNPMAAPAPVLKVLANGNAAETDRIATQRMAGVVGIDTTSLNGAWLETTTTRRFRLRARVPLADGGAVLVVRCVNLSASARDGMPWYTFRFEQRLEASAAVR